MYTLYSQFAIEFEMWWKLTLLLAHLSLLFGIICLEMVVVSTQLSQRRLQQTFLGIDFGNIILMKDDLPLFENDKF